MAIQNFFTSRDNNLDGNTYVGEFGRLWYNPDTNSIYASDGNTVGGIPVALATGADIIAGNIVADDVALNSITNRSGTILITGDIELTGSANIVGNISPAAVGKIGGITPGPGVNISNEGVLTIDSANVPLSFGNFVANNNVLSIVNVDEDMILQTEGDAEIQLIGNVGFYKPDGIPPDAANRYAFFNNDGQIVFTVPTVDPLLGAVQIIGSTSGVSVSPALAGVMLHVTGQNNQSSSIYNDGVGSNPNYIGRRYNGNAIAPTQVLSGETIVRFSGQGYSTGGFNPPADGTISLDALENFTQSNQGAIWRFLVNPLGGNVRQEVANISVANGVTATRFETSGTVTATGNITGGNLITGGVATVTGNVQGGNLRTVGQVSATGNITTSNFFVGNGALITGINAFGNVYANGVAVLATTGSSSLTVTPGTNITVTGDNGLKSMTIGVVSAPTFTGNVTGGNLLTGGVISATGNLSAGNISTAGAASVTGNVTAGNVNSYVTMPAGTTTKAPLIFTAGSVTTVPTVGSMNYDGRIFYATPQDSERGLLKAVQTYILNANYTLANQTGVQSLFGVSTSVSNNTRYAYVINAVIYKTDNNITMSYAMDGGSTLARHTYQTTTTAGASLATLSTPSVLKNILTTGFNTPVVVSSSLNGAGYYSLQVTGIVNVTTGGTWNPLIAFSGLPGATSYVAAGSSVEIYPVGIGNATVSIGNWS